jgi:hypothetical protein
LAALVCGQRVAIGIGASGISGIDGWAAGHQSRGGGRAAVIGEIRIEDIADVDASCRHDISGAWHESRNIDPGLVVETENVEVIGREAGASDLIPGTSCRIAGDHTVRELETRRKNTGSSPSFRPSLSPCTIS